MSTFITEAESLQAAFTDVDTLPLFVSKNPRAKSNTEKLYLSGAFDNLNDQEEERVKSCVFPKELKFSVDVNLRDSKRAYCTLISDELESDTEEDFLHTWGLDALHVEVEQPSSTE